MPHPEDVAGNLAFFEPDLGPTEIAVRWKDHDCDGDVVCVVHYVPEDLETNSQADAVLQLVYVNGCDVTCFFNRARYGLRIEEQAIREMEAKRKDAQGENQLARAGL
jgi:hypothetical protein